MPFADLYVGSVQSQNSDSFFIAVFDIAIVTVSKFGLDLSEF